jgi:enoyl-CoA hydratase/carnithine racemase/acyl carrier protein
VQWVIAPKAVGFWLLASVLGGAAAESCVVFSSVAAALGIVGQAVYAAANTWLDAHTRSRLSGGAVACCLQIACSTTHAISGVSPNSHLWDAPTFLLVGVPLACAGAPSRAFLTQALPSWLLTHLSGVVESATSYVDPACEEELLLALQATSLPRSTGEFIRLSIAAHVCLLELYDPSHFNALTQEMASDMQLAVAWLSAQGSSTSIVLQGAGDHFCPGGNLHRLRTPLSLVAAARTSIDQFDGFCRLRTLPIPTLCAAHGAILGGGLAVCLLTDHTSTNHTATLQVGERSRSIYPAALLTRTLADATGAGNANAFYLTEDKLTARAALEAAIIQAVTTCSRDAQQLARHLGSRFAVSAEASHPLASGLQERSGILPPSERQALAIDAFAQASGPALKNRAAGKPQGVVFTSTDISLTRSGVRTAIQAALSLADDTPRSTQIEWRDVQYSLPQTTAHVPAKHAMEQLLRLLSNGQADQQSQQSRSAAVLADEAAASEETGSEESHVDISPFAAQYCAAVAGQRGATPLEVLVNVYDHLAQMSVCEDVATDVCHDSSMSGGPARGISDASTPLVADHSSACLLLLRRAWTESTTQPPLIIAHSLIGDHRGYGRLWSHSLAHTDVYALRHRSLADASLAAPGVEGAMSIANEYAQVLLAAFMGGSFDLIGASFGAVLASHVALTARAAGVCSRYLICVDPPPAVPLDLRVPTMVKSLRTAAMGVLLLHTRIEMGATVWERFPQLQSLPEQALACFVAAQCLPAGASRANLVACAGQTLALLHVYRHCRHAFHVFSANIEATTESSSRPCVLMALSSERWPTFREMFPGIEDDDVDCYGPTATMRLSGQHIAMINRCLSNRDSAFTGAAERFLSNSFSDAWWWWSHVPIERLRAQPVAPLTTELLPANWTASVSALLAESLAGVEVMPPPPSSCHYDLSAVANIAATTKQVAQELIGSSSALDVDAPLMEAGIDSLGAVEFRSRLSSSLADVKLPETLIFDFPTLRQVNAHVSSLLQGGQGDGQENAAVDKDSLLRRLSTLVETLPQQLTCSSSSMRADIGAVFIHGASCTTGGGIRGVRSTWHASEWRYL